MRPAVALLLCAPSLGLGWDIPGHHHGQDVLADSEPAGQQQQQQTYPHSPPSTRPGGDPDAGPRKPFSEEAIAAAMRAADDPVDMMLALNPGVAHQLATPKLLHIMGDAAPTWMTEGDKMRLKKSGKKFADLTNHQNVLGDAGGWTAGKAHLPNLTHQNLIKPLFPLVNKERMYGVVKHMTSYYNRMYRSTHGQLSSEWLHDHIAEIIAAAPFGTHISLEYFPHAFPQSSIVARFEPKVRNFSQPVTILGAHQDSANYLFPLLPAPGADDDCSGSVSILEAFRVLAGAGYTPLGGPVEFHWYAAEEAGLLGSLDIAAYKRAQNQPIGAMMEFDMTAFVARNTTESIAMVSTQADSALTNWTVELGKEYISIPIDVFELGPNAGSDYMSFTMHNYPAAFATEGNPMHGGFPGDMCPYVHGVGDRMDVDDDKGYFSIDHMARFTELAIAYTIEQAGWNNKWR